MALEPAEVSLPGGSAGPRDLGITIADEFLARAAKEYQDGHVDATLWARATAQSGSDESLATAAYLRARATALLLQKREERAQRRARRANTMQGAKTRKLESQPRSEIPSTKAPALQPRGADPKRKYVASAAIALAFVVALAWMIGTPPQGDPVREPGVSAAAPSPRPPLPAGSEGSAQPVVGSASSGARPDGSEPTLEATVQQLKEDGNWNVLVLHASKWTREQPDNAVAWSTLGIGYANLRQFNDALVAATKAVELAPGDSLLWRNVGDLNLSLGNLPEAGNAFDKALAVNSDDADALCGAALVAQRQGRPKDAGAIAKRLQAADEKCPGVTDGASVTVPAGGLARRKPVSSAGQ